MHCPSDSVDICVTVRFPVALSLPEGCPSPSGCRQSCSGLDLPTPCQSRVDVCVTVRVPCCTVPPGGCRSPSGCRQSCSGSSCPRTDARTSSRCTLTSRTTPDIGSAQMPPRSAAGWMGEVVGWVGGWMSGWMDWWVDGWLGWMGRWVYG